MKRVLEIAMATVLMVALLPLMVLIGFLVVILDGRPILFQQERLGLNEAPFLLVKFRTMTTQVPKDGDEVTRLTALGRVLRNTSLDEIPSLWNVIKGDLSFVGPRPLLREYLTLYSPRHRHRHSVRPGLTGLAQVSGRNLLSWREKLDLDIEYVEKQSLLLDLRILAKTLWVVLTIRGINQANGRTMERLQENYDR